MPWIESHTELAGHPKTLQLARRLAISIPTTIGHLHLLWWWALTYAPEGDLGRFDAVELAMAAMWDGDPAEFLTALTAARWLDEDRHLHDWEAYAGRLLEKRRSDAERKRAVRSQPPSFIDQRPPDIRRTSAGHPSDGAGTVPNRTVPNRTVPNLTGPDQPGSARARAPRTRAPVTPAFIDELATEFGPQLGGEQRARDIIADALNHTASTKQIDQRQYLRKWLRQDAEKFTPEDSHGATRAHPERSDIAAGLAGLEKYTG